MNSNQTIGKETLKVLLLAQEVIAIIDPLMETLYIDCDISLESEFAKGMVSQGYLCLETPTSAPAWAEGVHKGRPAYFRTALDQINPAFAQDKWVQATRVQCDVVNMETSHAPYISQPDKLTENLVGFTHKFAAKPEVLVRP